MRNIAASNNMKRSLAPNANDLLHDRNGCLPLWVRAPARGPEHYSGLTRAKLYDLAGKGSIRSVSLREPGKAKGCRLFNLPSILDYINSNVVELEEGRE